MKLTKICLLALLFSASGFASNFLMPAGVDWARGGSVWLREDGHDVNAYFAGVIFITLNEDGQLFYRDTLCVDLFTDIYLGVNYDTSILHPNQVPGKNLNRVSWLVDNALMPTQGPIYSSLLPAQDWVYSAAQGAGIQLAIWDIVHDNGDGFSAGRLQAVTDPGHPTDPTVLAWAQFYENASFNRSSDLSFIYVNVDLGNGQPAQMLAGPRFLDGGPHPNPEPATVLLVASALAAVVVSVKRKRTAEARGRH